MANERLRRAVLDAGLTREQLASTCGVDPKTVERWITQGRVPYLRHRLKVVELVAVPAVQLWPELAEHEPELIELFPCRAAVPRETWLRLLVAATDQVALLAWAATFFHQLQPWVARLLVDATSRGARVRLCFGDPASPEVAARELEEPLLGPGVLASKIRVSLGYYRDLVDVDGIEIRLHRSVVYASLFHYDDEVIVNPHVYGRPASENPALHLRRGPMFDAYVDSFDQVWDTATPWKGEQV